MGFTDMLPHLLDYFRIFACQIILLSRIFVDAVKLHYIVTVSNICYKSLPFSHSYTEPASVILEWRKFPIQIFMLLLLLSLEHRKEGYTVCLRASDFCNIAKSRHDVREISDVVTYFRFNPVAPADNEWNSYSSFVKGQLM